MWWEGSGPSVSVGGWKIFHMEKKKKKKASFIVKPLKYKPGPFALMAFISQRAPRLRDTVKSDQRKKERNKKTKQKTPHGDAVKR